MTDASVTDTLRADDRVLLKLHQDFSVEVVARVGWYEIPALIADLNQLILEGQNREIEATPGYQRMMSTR